MGTQDKINEMFRAKEQQDKENRELAAKIMDESKQTSNALIEEAKKRQIINELISNEELTEEEREYCKSPYFQNYVTLIMGHMDLVVQNIQTSVIQQYNYNNTYFKNPFYKEIESKQLISNIGFPIPTKFIDKIGTIIVEKLDEMKMTELLGVDCEVSIEPYEYQNAKVNNSQSSVNVIKNTNCYLVAVKARQTEVIKESTIK